MGDITIAAVILAGGAGERMGGDTPKQYLKINGKAILNYSLDLFEKSPYISEIVVVAPAGGRKYCSDNFIKPFNYKKVTGVVEGGKTRQHSSFNGLNTVSADYVLIHDGARPFAGMQLIEKLAQGLKGNNAVVPVLPALDTVKKVDPTCGRIVETLDREVLYYAQTPQAFKKDLIVSAIKKAFSAGFIGTDDACLVERLGEPVYIIMGSRENIKITDAFDMIMAEALITRNANENC